MTDYTDGLLDAQRLANEYAQRAHNEDRFEARDALLALSSELVTLRQEAQAHR